MVNLQSVDLNFPCIKNRQIYLSCYICPHCDMRTGSLGLLFGPVGTFSIFLITNNPSITRPNTTCLLSKKLHFAQVMKN